MKVIVREVEIELDKYRSAVFRAGYNLNTEKLELIIGFDCDDDPDNMDHHAQSSNECIIRTRAELDAIYEMAQDMMFELTAINEKGDA